MDDFNTFLDIYGLLAIFGVMLAKSAGVPIPIPADALMLATSARVVAGRVALVEAFTVLLVALVFGGMVQFILVRGPGRGVVYRYGRYLGLTPERLDAASKRVKQSGSLGIGLAVLTPGVRSIAVIGCGLAGVPLRVFALGLSLGSALFLGLHFFLGYIGGMLLSLAGSVISPPLLLVGFAALFATGFLTWYIIRRKQMPGASAGAVLAEAAGAWHEATCPVCLALGAAERLQIHGHEHRKGHSNEHV